MANLILLAAVFICIFLSALALGFSVFAWIEVQAQKRSTHRVQFMPLDEMLKRNKDVEEKLNNIYNPGKEDSEWHTPLTDIDI